MLEGFAMLVIVSDLHLNDGTAGALLDAGAAELFTDRVCELAYRACWRADGSYQPIQRLDLVLLGDVLDIVRSQRWLSSDVRPWSDLHSPAGVEMVSGIVGEILRKNVEIIRQIRALATEGLVTVPLAGSDGKPMSHHDEMPVAVRTHYMVGNHDWPLHLPGASYDLLRHKVAHHLGLASPHNKPFPHEAAESEELADALRRHRVLARHGDIFDPLAFADDRDASSIGDALAVELLARFLQRIESELAGDLTPAAMAALREIDQIRPTLLAAPWIECTLERHVPQLAIRNIIKRLWDNLVDDLLELEIIRQRSRWTPADVIDGLAGALMFSKRDSSHWMQRTLRWQETLRGASSQSYVAHALAEADLRNRRARHIVYGHTHHHEAIPLDASHADGYVLNQSYVNAGTWRRTYSPTQVAAATQEFVASETFSLLAFYQADERSGRSYETCSGMLAPKSAYVSAPPAPLVAETNFGSQLRAPHFGRQGVRSRM
jgi:UDP-2,3-diacylglucosamine pyrophosphatase LpxH